MAKGNTGNKKATEKSRKSTIKVQQGISKPTVNEDEIPRRYYCQSCGKSFKNQKDNFPATQSPMFAGNNGYTHMCKACVDKWFNWHYETLSENEEKAMDRMAALFDWYYSDEIMASTRKISADRSRVCAYPAKMNLPQHNKHEDKSPVTYMDTIKDRSDNVIGSMAQLEQLKAEGKTSTSNASVERWGMGIFNDTDYKILDDHYKMLKKQNPNCDNNQEIFIKDLCYTKLQQMTAMKDKDPDDFKTLTQLYRETFKQAGLKTTQESDTSTEEALGVTLALISQYTPEEYYKDKKLYKDFDGLGSYITRFITRPLKNLQFGANDRDEEYCVKDDADEE